MPVLPGVWLPVLTTLNNSTSGRMVRVKLAEVKVFTESVTRTPNVKLPKTVGVPEINPEAFSDSPAGSAPETHVHVYGGLPVAASNCSLYGSPCLPLAMVSVVIVKTRLCVMIVRVPITVELPAASSNRTDKVCSPLLSVVESNEKLKPERLAFGKLPQTAPMSARFNP